MKTINHAKGLLTFCCLLFTSQVFASSMLTLEEYVNQVKTKNQAFQSANDQVFSAENKKAEAELIYATQLTLSGQDLVDKKTSPLLPYKELDNLGISVGVSKMFSSGTALKLGYGVSQSQYKPVAPTFWEGKPSLEVSQSLWKNGFGSELKALSDQMVAGANAKTYGAKFQAKMLILEAEMSYWRLVLSRQILDYQKLSEERAKKMVDWNSKRTLMSLSDPSDLMQAQAAYEGAKMNLQGAYDEVRSASRAFNRVRSLDSEIVQEDLVQINSGLIESLEGPKARSPREDVLAMASGLEATKAGAVVGKQKYLPTVDAFGQFALNGLKTGMSDAVSNSFSTDKPTFVVGLKMSMPLDFGLISRSKQSYDLDVNAAELDLQKKQSDQEIEWKNLNEDLKEAKQRLALTKSLVELQQKKLDHERSRFTRGRSTTYQVLMFEDQLTQSQLALVRSELQCLQIVSQLKTHGGNAQ